MCIDGHRLYVVLVCIGTPREHAKEVAETHAAYSGKIGQKTFFTLCLLGMFPCRCKIFYAKQLVFEQVLPLKLPGLLLRHADR